MKSPNCGEGAFGGNPCLAPPPHVRGEDNAKTGQARPERETPPRAWGRQTFTMNFGSGTGNTSTCVGKTITFIKKPLDRGKHPHVRGEDDSVALSWPYVGETPPRAWGRRTEQAHRVCGRRNTPTCVGKTREEKGVTCPVSETPPRAWGRRFRTCPRKRSDRNTPTCVGKTWL